MPATLALPATVETARRAARILSAWTADPEMPDVAGCAEDAVRVLAIRAAVLAETKDEGAAALPAPAVVELTARLLVSQFSELTGVIERAGHAVVYGAEGSRWEPGDYLHQAYAAAFGPATGRHWPV
ncbi:hypothetical protein [Streptomyces sp. S1D4-14]|uniref:hypothetical protein n=1 Tax=Streptomyces sp. S1D4-14 TaxID=2594461 RepID=UPI001163213A|nr:hypothetical protein [Streptomyces sp. S1D4-14]QDN64431.1 hypothetical protein FNV66_00955 [Streptomyces sp. S1D4-14]